MRNLTVWSSWSIKQILVYYRGPVRRIECIPVGGELRLEFFGGALRVIRDMRCNCTFTVELREGGKVMVYRTKGYSLPDIKQVELAMEQGARI